MLKVTFKVCADLTWKSSKNILEIVQKTTNDIPYTMHLCMGRWPYYKTNFELNWNTDSNFVFNNWKGHLHEITRTSMVTSLKHLYNTQSVLILLTIFLGKCTSKTFLEAARCCHQIILNFILKISVKILVLSILSITLQHSRQNSKKK